MTTNRETIYLDRSDTTALATVAVLQALYRVKIPANAQVALERYYGDYADPPATTALFDTPRRFVLWAVMEGLVPDEYRREALRYARA
jgi:hypothetical protein